MLFFEVEEPQELIDLRTNDAQLTWRKLKSNTNVNFPVKVSVFKKTGGLCLYCEQKLIPKVDYQIEHFQPKKGDDNYDYGEGEPNWSVEWSNLYPCCLGGTAQASQLTGDEVDARTGANKKNKKALTCGQRKKDKDVAGIFIDPVLRAGKRIYAFKPYEGEIYVDPDACNKHSICSDLAQVNLEQLNLDSDRLKRARSRFAADVDEQIGIALGEDEKSTGELVDMFFVRDDEGLLEHPFLSLVDYMLNR